MTTSNNTKQTPVFRPKAGLRPTPRDIRDFALGAVYPLPRPDELPERFEIKTLGLKNQLDTDFCTAFASTLMNETQEGVPLEPSWSFAASKMLSGHPEWWGQDIRTALKAHVKFGAIEEAAAPMSLRTTPASKLRYINNWDRGLFEKAKKHRKKSYFRIVGQYDHFDNIRGAIWAFRDKKCIVGFGTRWGWGLYQYKIEAPASSGFGHMAAIVGWTKEGGKEYLIVQNSYGEAAGSGGYHLFSREVINASVEQYGAFMFLDEDPEEVKKNHWTFWQKVVHFIRKLLHI